MGTLPTALAEIVDDFAALGDSDKVTLLLEFAGELPPLPDDLATEAMEPVPECQSPLFLAVDADDRLVGVITIDDAMRKMSEAAVSGD